MLVGFCEEKGLPLVFINRKIPEFYRGRAASILKKEGKMREAINYLLSPVDSAPSERRGSSMSRGFSAAAWFNDVSALGVYSLFQQLKKGIPQDFSLIGTDDIFPALVASSPLTTVRINRQRLTERAPELLKQLLTREIETQRTEYLDTQLILRKSAFENTAGFLTGQRW